MIQHAWHFFNHPHYTVATDFKKENNIDDLDETKANIHFQQFWWDSRASGYDQKFQVCILF